jgi:hypothetical protein
MNVTLRYTEALVRSSVKRFCWRQVGWLYVVALALVLVGLATGLARGDRSWLAGVLVTILLIGVVMPISLYRTLLAGSLERYRSLDNQPALFSGDDISYVIQSTAGLTKLNWKTIASVCRYDDLWLLVFDKGGFMTFPLEGVSAADRDFLLERVKAHGGRIY